MKKTKITKCCKLRRFFAIFIAATTLMTGCAISSGASKTYGTSAINQKALQYAYAYDKQETPRDFPNQMIDQLGKYKVVMAGELHYVKEHQVMVSLLVQRLHEKGLRYFMNETADSRGYVIDGYIKGKISSLKDEQLKMNETVIEALKAFNARLRAENRADEQISYISFDINHSDTEYYNAIDLLSESFQSEALIKYRREIAAAKADSGYEYKKAIDTFLTELDNTKDANNPYKKLSAEQKKILKEMTQGEQTCYALRNNMVFSKREDFIYEKVKKAIKDTKGEEKIFMTIGMNHAQYVGEWESEVSNEKNIKWLGMRLREDLSKDPKGLYSFSITTYKGVFKTGGLRDSALEKYVFETKEKNAFVKAIQSKYGSKNVFVDFTPLTGEKEKMLIHYPFVKTELAPNVQFSGLLVFPEMSVDENCKYYER